MNEVEALKRCDMLINGMSVDNSINEAFKDYEKGYVTCKKMKKFAETCKTSLERQNAKKPTVDEFDYGNGYVCGVCESFLHYVDDDDEHIRTNYCCHCGQKLDWS